MWSEHPNRMTALDFSHGTQGSKGKCSKWIRWKLGTFCVLMVLHKRKQSFILLRNVNLDFVRLFCLFPYGFVWGSFTGDKIIHFQDASLTQLKNCYCLQPRSSAMACVCVRGMYLKGSRWGDGEVSFYLHVNLSTVYLYFQRAQWFNSKKRYLNGIKWKLLHL